MSYICRMALLVLCAVMSGCASKITNEQMIAETAGFEIPDISSSNDVVVYIGRLDNSGLNFDEDVAYRLDEKKDFIGKLFKGQYFYFKTTPGEHTLYWRGVGLEPDSVHANKKVINLEAGKTYFFNHLYFSMFNRYSETGISLVDRLSEVESIEGKWLMSKKELASPSNECLKKTEISAFRKLCL